MTEYPEELLRGISCNNEQFITPEGYPTQAVFRFDEYNPERKDGFRELSINWVDDEVAVDLLLKQINPRNNQLQFQGGYCKIRKSSFNSMNVYFDKGHLNYERRPCEANGANSENKYHGNILMKDGLSKQAIINIQVTLAGLAGEVIPREPNNPQMEESSMESMT